MTVVEGENPAAAGEWPDGQGPLRADGPTEAETLIVDVAGFEGPLDLLLELARHHKIDLSRISMLALAEQYLAFIEGARRLQLAQEMPPGVVRHRVVRLVRHDQRHVAAGPRLHDQRAEQHLVRDEVRRHDHDAALGLLHHRDDALVQGVARTVGAAGHDLDLGITDLFSGAAHAIPLWVRISAPPTATGYLTDCGLVLCPVVEDAAE